MATETKTGIAFNAETLAAGTHTERVNVQTFLTAIVYARHTAPGGALAALDVHIDASNFENPDATDDADWVLDALPALDLFAAGADVLNSASFALEDVPRWIRIRVILAGDASTVTVIVGGKGDL